MDTITIRKDRFRSWLLVLACASTVLFVAAPPPARAEDPPVKMLGLFPRPPGVDNNNLRWEAISNIDPVHRVLYYLYALKTDAGSRVALYDLRPPIPRYIKEYEILDPLRIGLPGPLRVQRDSRRNRLLILDATGVPYSFLLVIDLNTGVVQKHPFPFHVQGYTYSTDDDLIYLLGESSINNLGSNLHGQRPQVLTLLGAVNPVTMVPRWIIPVAQCQQPMYEGSQQGAAPIYRSTHRPALYFPCVRSRMAPRVSGLVRVTIAGNATEADALRFPIDFFPISGAYHKPPDIGLLPAHGINSTALFDYATDRILLPSLSITTPGAWVFDGAMSAWAGFIAMPGVMSTFGLNQGSGHFYVSDPQVPHLLISDGRGTPVPQGSVLPGYPFRYYILTDPGSNRFFGLALEKDLGISDLPDDLNVTRWVVMQDDTVSEPPLAPTDYDALTSDIPEGPGTTSTYAGGIAGYGSRVLLVGGLGGARTGTNAGNAESNAVGLGPGDREAFFGRIARLDIRDTGSSASAQSVASDGGTQSEWDTRPATVRRQCAERAGSNGSSCSEVEPTLGAAADAAFKPWPWSPATCLDGTGRDVSGRTAGSEGMGGEAEVRCSLKTQRSEARVTSPSFGTEGSPVSATSSSVDAVTHRDPAGGATTTVVAVARGVRLESSVGSVVIGEVQAEAVTAAHGRPGTAKASWDRRLSGIVVRQAGGQAQRLPDCVNDGCHDQLLSMNRALGEFVRVEMPGADITRTPKGAFAGVQKTTGDYLQGLTVQNDQTKAAPALQVVAYADREQKLRLLAQFAGIEATSLYTISRGGEFSPSSGGEVVPPAPDLGGAAGGSSLPPALDPPPAVTGGQPSSGLGGFPGSIPRAVAQAVGFIVRSPSAALQVGLILMLLAAAPASIARRRSFRTALASRGQS